MTSQVIRIGKKFAIYLPKKVVEELGVKEGDPLVVQVVGKNIVLKPISGLKIAKPWGRVKPEEVEEVGRAITREILE